MSAIRGPRYQQQHRKKPTADDELHSYIMPLEHHDDNDGHEMYSMPYYEEDEAQDDYERKTHAFEQRQRAMKEQRSSAFRPERHVARIEITNGEKDSRNDVDRVDGERTRKPITKIREVTAVQRSFSEHKNVRAAPTSQSTQPPPPAPNMRTSDKVNLKKVMVNVHKEEPSVERRGDEHYKRRTEANDVKSPAKNLSEKLQRPPQADQMTGKMIVVHMERAHQTPPARATESRSSAGRRPSTNPFANGEENRRQSESTAVNQQIHNVQEVVQRMNSGDWPIKIDEEEHAHRDNHRRGQVIPNQRSASKAHNWETLRRDKPARDSGRQRSSPEQEHPKTEQRGNHFGDKNREIEREQSDQADETGYRSDSSDQCEHTTVSTDSAFASEGCVGTHQLDIPGVHKISPGSAKHLDEEARKLLLYFKSHRMLLNYLGIGLTETLWHYISALPMQNVHISVAEEIRPNPRLISDNTEAYVSSHTAPSRKSPPPGSKARKSERSAPAQSPRLVALERQLRTDDLANDFIDKSRGYSSDGEGKQSDSRWKLFVKGGRFVKKSAAALIAKKQGYALQSGTDEPNSSEIVDPRIASEIRALREREDELRRSRTELGLPTLDDVMKNFDRRAFTQNNLRSARSYDQLHQIGNEGYYFRAAEQSIEEERNHFLRSSSIHNSAKINRKGNQFREEPSSRSEEKKKSREQQRRTSSDYSSHMDL